MESVAQESPEWECVLDARAQIGEMPVWVPEEQALYFIDINDKSLNKLTPHDGARQRWEAPAVVGSYAFTPDLSHVLIAARDKLYWLNKADGVFREAASAVFDTDNYRLNDGRCDRAGRFWIGLTRERHSEAEDGGASWYRFDERGFLPQFGDVTIANGLAWSPDNRTMYIADRPNWQILAFDYDLETGVASNRRRFTSIPEGYVPDGAAVDSEGCYWVAMFRVGRIFRFRPDGTLDRDLRAPTAHPTMVSFGGPDLSTLYITTARYIADTAVDPLAGAIFKIDAGVRGIAEPRFTRMLP